jgi:hypothetical protein
MPDWTTPSKDKLIDLSCIMGTVESGAVFSSSNQHRYSLWRVWNALKPIVCYVLLNPSTATHEIPDPTVMRCVERAKQLGFGGIEIVNLFALRTSTPAVLYRHPDPVGVDNNEWIAKATSKASMIICGWGAHGDLFNRGIGVQRLLQNRYPSKVHYLKMNRNGTPAHPLYLPYDLEPVLWKNKVVKSHDWKDVTK